VGIQFFRPERSNPELEAKNDLRNVPGTDSSSALIFRRACYDCHSNETRWPWYSNIAPVSWFLASDVHTGRKHLNFSLWGKYASTRRSQSLDDIQDEISSGDMPLPAYLLLHPSARLTAAEKDTVLAWARREKQRIGSD
jgi:hypothetical protein